MSQQDKKPQSLHLKKVLVTVTCLLVFLTLVLNMTLEAKPVYPWEVESQYEGTRRYQDKYNAYFTKYYQQVKQKVAANTATNQELWDYNILLRQAEVRGFLKLDMSEEAAIQQADEILQQTYQQRLPSAVLQMAYQNIEAGIGEPVYQYKHVSDYYPDIPKYFMDAKVVNANKLAEGLADIIELLKTQPKGECYADYHPVTSYPYLNNNPNAHPEMYILKLNMGIPDWTDNPKIIEYLELKIGNIIDMFPRSAVADYPDIKRQLDLIALRNKVHCQSAYHNLTIIGGYLIGQSIDDIDTYDYASIHMPVEMDHYHEQLFLSAFAQLMEKPEFLSVFASRVPATQKEKFLKDRAALMSDYQATFVQ